MAFTKTPRDLVVGYTVGGRVVLGQKFIVRDERYRRRSVYVMQCLSCSKVAVYRPEFTGKCSCSIPLVNAAENTTHGLSKTNLYARWMAMKERCYNQNHRLFSSYGGRGIEICDEWLRFEAFADWAMKNGFSKKLQIDRIDNDAGYGPSNCRFVTHRENQRNASRNRWITAFGETKILEDWASDSRCAVRSVGTIIARIARRMSPEAAISTPSMSSNQHHQRSDAL